MTQPEIRQVVLDILARIAPDEDFADLNDERPFREQMDLDSMDFLDIVMELRKRFRIHVPDDQYENLATLSGAVAWLTPRLAEAPAPA